MKLRRTRLWWAIRAALAMLLVLLTACTPKQDTVRADTEWKAPTVDCMQGRTPDFPAPPLFWFLDGPAWAVQVLGIAIEERRLRKVEHECIEQHRAMGLIR